ncbi:MAG: hypothetical protein IKP47_02985 [Ruminococcus sp.]|nr:hypothetical protein [Ruminococcus sp.]
MNKAVKIIYAALFFGICAVPLCAAPFVESNAEIEKKELAEMPSIVKDGSLNTDFSTEFESWYNDRLPFRSELLTAADYVKSELLSSPASTVITGSDGYLFYDGSKADFMDTNAMSETRLRATAVTLSLIEENVKAKNGRFLFFCAPNKESIYGEYMPACYTKAEETNLTRLHALLSEYGVTYLDMKQVLTDNKDQGLYHKRDTHWNYLGARLGYNAVMDALGKEHKTYADAAYTVTKDWRADLDKLLYPAGDGILDDQYRFDIEWDEFEFAIPAGVEDTAAQLENFISDKEENDTRISTKNYDADGRLYMVRDSFGRALLPFMIDNYEKAMFVRTTCPELSMVSEGGDMIYEIVERNLRNLTETAPFMFAPERSISLPADTAGEVKRMEAKNEGYACRIYGLLPDDTDMSDGRVYVTVANSAGAHTFEAFPVCESKMLGEESEKAFSLMIDPALELSGEYTVTVTTGGRSYTCASKAIF